MAMDTPAAATSTHSGSRSRGWYGMVVFAATMMILLGTFHAIAGLVALFRDDYFLVTQSGLVIDADFTTWGWVHLLFGVIVVAAGAALYAGATWARFTAVVIAMLSAILNLAFLASYPLWSVIMIAVDVLVIYAVTAHGGPDDGV
jgi:hypothetical protein